jgi:hypothetical protein
MTFTLAALLAMSDRSGSLAELRREGSLSNEVDAIRLRLELLYSFADRIDSVRMYSANGEMVAKSSRPHNRPFVMESQSRVAQLGSVIRRILTLQLTTALLATVNINI